MIRVVAITQFVFLALGAFAINVIVRSGNYSQKTPPHLSIFLAHYGGWLLVLPVIWMAYASICQTTERGPFSTKGAQVVGVLLAAGILAVYSYAILWQS